MELQPGEVIVDPKDLHYTEKEKIITIINALKIEFNLEDWDFNPVVTTTVGKELPAHTLSLSRKPEWILKWRATVNEIAFWMYPNTTIDKPYRFTVTKNHVAGDPIPDIIKVGIQWLKLIDKKEKVDEEFSNMFFGRKEFHNDISFDNYPDDVVMEFSRDFTTDERTDFRQLLFAWIEGVKKDSNLSEQAAITAMKVHEMAQKELESSTSVIEMMIRTENTMRAMTDKFRLKSFGHYLRTSGIALTLSSAFFAGWSGYVGGGIGGGTIGLIAYMGTVLSERAFKQSQL